MLGTAIVVAVGIALTLVLIVGSLVGGLVYQFRFSPRARLRRRMGVFVGGGGASGGDRAAKGGAPRRRAVQAKLKELEEAQKKSTRRRAIRQQIQETGLEYSVGQFYMASVVLGIATGAAYMLSVGFHERELMKNLAIAGGITLASGFMVPKFVLGFLAGRRQNKFTKYFADAVDVIVRGIQTGLPIGECLNIIANESPDPVGTEFHLIVEGQKLGLTIDEVMKRATDRMPISELRFFAIVLNIQQQTGGNLAETLGNLSRVLRERKKMGDKVKAMSSEARSTAMIIGSLPFILGLILYFVNPEYILLLFNTDGGNIMLGIGFGLLFTGAMVMRAMINFKV